MQIFHLSLYFKVSTFPNETPALNNSNFKKKYVKIIFYLILAKNLYVSDDNTAHF